MSHYNPNKCLKYELLFSMTRREKQILALVQADPLLSQQELAKSLGISRSAVAGHIMHLTDKGIIKGRGYVFSDAPFVAVIGGANIDIQVGRSAEARPKGRPPWLATRRRTGPTPQSAPNLAPTTG